MVIKELLNRKGDSWSVKTPVFLCVYGGADMRIPTESGDL